MLLYIANSIISKLNKHSYFIGILDMDTKVMFYVYCGFMSFCKKNLLLDLCRFAKKHNYEDMMQGLKKILVGVLLMAHLTKKKQ